MPAPSPLPESQPPFPSEAPDRTADARIVLRESGRVTDLSQERPVLFDGTTEEVIGQSIADLLPAPLGSRVRAAVQQVASGAPPIPFDAYHPEAQQWVEIRVDAESDGITLHVRDVTPRKQAQKWLHLLDSTVLQGCWEMDADDTIVSVNDAFARFLGYDHPGALEGRSASELYVDPAFWPRLRETVACKGRVESVVCTFRRNDGREVDGATHLTALRDPAGRLTGVKGVVVEAQSQHGRHQELVDRAVDATTDAIAVTAATASNAGAPQITYVNAAFADLTGYSADAVVGESIDVLFGPATDAETLETLEYRLQAERPFRGEMLSYRNDGTPYVARWSVAPVYDADGTTAHWVWLHQDVTGERGAEDAVEDARVEVLYRNMGPLLQAATIDQLASELIDLVRSVFSFSRVVVRRRRDRHLTVLASSDDSRLSAAIALDADHPAARAATSNGIVADDAHLHVPLGSHGVLSVDTSDGETAPPFRLLDVLADHTTAVLDRLAEAADQRAAHQRCEALRAASLALLDADSMQESATGVLGALAPLLPEAVRYSVLAWERDDDEAAVLAASEPPLSGLERGATIRADDRLRRWAAEGALHVLRQSEGTPQVIEEALEHDGCHSGVAVPLLGNGTQGVLLLAAEARDAFSEEHCGLVEDAGDLVARALPSSVQPTAAVESDQTPAEPVKPAFLANLHHELRTPLTSIIGFAEVLSADDTSGPARYADLIAQSGRGLEKTFDNLITLSRLEAGTMPLTPRPLSVPAQIRIALELVEERAREAGLRLSTKGLDADVEAVLDRDGLHDILEQLLDNALTFTEEGTVTVRLRVDDASDMIAIDVIDTGIGMPPDCVPEVFAPFEQIVTGRTQAHEGCGLGLAIVRDWVDAMGGTIDVETALGKGTGVTVWLPQAVGPVGNA